MRYSFISTVVGLGISFTSCNNAQKVEEQPTVAIAVEDTAQETEVELSEPNDGVELGFFNPIHVIGEGVVNILSYIDNGDKFDFVTIYNDSQCTDLYSRYNFVDTYKLPAGKNINPIYKSVDYGYYYFVCTDEKSGSYEIAINQNDRKYIKKDKNIERYSWGQFFEKVFYINPTEENPFRELPDDNSPIVTIKDYDDDYEIYPERKVKIEGDWLHLSFPRAHNKSVWIRWKKGNDIIINISISL